MQNLTSHKGTSKHKSSGSTRQFTVFFKNKQTLKFKGIMNTHKTDRNPLITNHKPWPFEPVEVSFCFLRGHLESAKPSDYDCWAEKPQILTPFYMAGRIRNSWYKGLIVCQLLIFVLCFGFFNSELCELPPVTGPCRAAFPRWYYNSTAGKCLEFTYGGCMGNANNFDTDSNCTITCAPSVVAQKGLC